MSVNVFNRDKIGTADELEVIATKGRNRTYIGTKDAVQAAIKRGDVGDNSVVYITDDYREKSSTQTPVGVILPFAGAQAPEGYLICDGSTYDTAKYPNLFTLLKKDTVPDLRNRFLMGSSVEAAADTYIAESLPQHTHPLNGTNAQAKSAGSHNHVGGLGGTFASFDQAENFFVFGPYAAGGSTSGFAGGLSGVNYLPRTSFAGSHSHTLEGNTANANNATYQSDAKVRPDSYVVTYIIKAE